MKRPPFGKIRVVHVLSWLERGGAELRTLRMLQLANRDRFEFDIVATSGRRGSLDSAFQQAGAVVHYIPLNFWFFLRFPRWLRARGTGVVHSHIHLASGPIVALAWLAGVRRRVVHFRNTHDRSTTGLSRRIQQAVKRALVQVFATDIVAVSESALRVGWRQDWRRDARCAVIYNGIESPVPMDAAARMRLRYDLGASSANPLVVHLARMAEQKNHHKALAVFAAIARMAPEARFAFVGREDPQIVADLREGVRANGLESRVYFAGERNDAMSVLEAADMLLFPSFWEGLPGAVLEASAVGTPVLGSDIPPIVEVAAHLNCIETQPLSAPDEKWAETAMQLLAGSAGARDRFREEFASSPFQVKRALAALEELWNRGGGK